MRKLIQVFGLGLALTAAAFSARAEELLKPFVLAYKTGGSMDVVVEEVRKKLSDGGFEIVGSYSPYETATIIAITNDEIKQTAAKSEFGAYGAAQRVSVTKVGDEFQVAYTNPPYMAAGYRMGGDLKGVATRLATVLGSKEFFGPDEGMSAEDLREYHYMFGMEYFDEPSELATYDSYEQGVATVEKTLAEGVSGVTQVYRVDVPGKKETVFGVAMAGEKERKFQDDRFLMSKIDFKPLRSTAHLPYEIVVSGNRAYALYARFRIALNFPDLSMMGSNSFMSIMESPKAIERALILAAGGELTAEHWD
jgi:hypothetical protein